VNKDHVVMEDDLERKAVQEAKVPEESVVTAEQLEKLVLMDPMVLLVPKVLTERSERKEAKDPTVNPVVWVSVVKMDRSAHKENEVLLETLDHVERLGAMD